MNTAHAKGPGPAFTFSTGTLRGHEAAPIVVGNTMDIVTPFPNYVYALDLAKPGAPARRYRSICNCTTPASWSRICTACRSGAVFPLLGAWCYGFRKITGRMMSERLGRWQFALMLVGFRAAFFPMHLLRLTC